MSELLQEQTEVRERFVVDNDMKAEWCLNKIRKIRNEQKREIDELQRQMQFYQDQMDAVTKQAQSEIDFFESMLRGYFADRTDSGFAKESKTQISYKLPSGKLILKHPQPEFVRQDDELIGWLKKNASQFIKVKETPDWAELKKTVTINGENVVTKDGEIIPGVKVVESEDKFVVEVN